MRPLTGNLELRNGIGLIPAPPGVTIPPQLAAMVDLIVGHLHLEDLGLYSPWATRTSDVSWEEIRQPPDLNIAVAGFSDSLLLQSSVITMGQGIAFLAVLSETLPTQTTLRDALRGTAYGYYETQGVYRQSDTAAVPRISFLHWIQRRMSGDSDYGGGSLDGVAKAFGGRLVLAMQTPGQGTVMQRPAPALTFSLALQQQLGIVPTGLPGTSTIDPTLVHVETPPVKKSNMFGDWLLPGLVGLGLAAGTFAAVRAARGKKSGGSSIVKWRG
jgi:hypothetical protein